MDTTETHIKMSDTPEIQDGEIADDDYIVVSDGTKILYQGLAGFHPEPFLSPTPVKIVKLLRQDQSQEISGFDWRSFDRKCLVYEHTVLVPTKEQAGIRVVMKEKYNKTWDGREWYETNMG